MSNPVNKTDLQFLKHFSMIIGFLVLVTAALMAVAAYLYALHPPPQNPLHAQQVESRITPIGDAYAGDTGRAAKLATEQAAQKAAAAQVAYGGTTDGKTIFGNLCHSCHETGVAGAPMLTDKANWAPRVAQGLDTLVSHAINGYNGKAGAMPARGGNPSLNDAQVKATVEWMLTQVK